MRVIRRAWYAFIHHSSNLVLWAMFGVKAYGSENVPAEGAAILAANHQSYIDPALVSMPLSRQVHFMARKSLFQANFLFAWLIRSLNAYPVERDRGDLGAVRETMRRLKNGAAIVVFPEATRTKDGSIGELKPGLFVIAVKADALVVPTFIDGAYEAWPRTHKLPHRHPITVSFGKPIRHEDFAGDAEAMRDACIKALLDLQTEAQARRQARI